MADFADKKHAECRIPHVVISNGVKIETSCGGALRLTPDHLVFTQRGLIAAGDVQSNDVLFADEEQTKQVIE